MPWIDHETCVNVEIDLSDYIDNYDDEELINELESRGYVLKGDEDHDDIDEIANYNNLCELFSQWPDNQEKLALIQLITGVKDGS